MKFDLSVSAYDENDLLLPSGILSKHHSLYRVACSSAASLKTQAPRFSLAVVMCLTIYNSQASYGCKYYVHNWANPILRSTLPPISASRLGTRCNGLRVYAVCVCNKVRLPGTGQSPHVIGGSRFTRPASNSRRTLLN